MADKGARIELEPVVRQSYIETGNLTRAAEMHGVSRQTAAIWKPGTLAAYPMLPDPIAPTPINPILTLSLAPLRLPVKMEEVRAAAPAAFRKSLRPVNGCAIPLVVSGFAAAETRRGQGKTRRPVSGIVQV